jgi:hypothetical protein
MWGKERSTTCEIKFKSRFTFFDFLRRIAERKELSPPTTVIPPSQPNYFPLGRSIAALHHHCVYTTPTTRRNMDWNTLSQEQKDALYATRRHYEANLKKLAYEAYGNVCPCGSTHKLRIRFKDRHDPNKARYNGHPSTLCKALLTDPEFRKTVGLFCDACRLRLHFAAFVD